MGHYRHSRVTGRRPARLRWLDEHEWVALDDRDALGALAYQRGCELQGLAGQGATRAAGDGDREGLGALVAGAGAAELPAGGRVEGLAEHLRGPGLADRGHVDRADGE